MRKEIKFGIIIQVRKEERKKEKIKKEWKEEESWFNNKWIVLKKEG